MALSFTTQIDLLDFGGVKELLINQKSRYFEVLSEGSLLTAICKIKDDLWIELQGNYPQEIIDSIGETIDKKLEIPAW